jgi:putative transposase
MAKDPKMFPGGIYFVSPTVVGWTEVFTRIHYRQIIVENLQFCVENKGLQIYCLCLMTNHLHMFVGCEDGDVQTVLRHFKSFTAKKMLDAIESNLAESKREWLMDRFEFFAKTRAQDTQRQFWERNNYPEEIRSDSFFLQKQKYIHENPVKAGFVARPEDWWHSSANPECPVTISEAF